MEESKTNMDLFIEMLNDFGMNYKVDYGVAPYVDIIVSADEGSGHYLNFSFRDGEFCYC